MNSYGFLMRILHLLQAHLLVAYNIDKMQSPMDFGGRKNTDMMLENRRKQKDREMQYENLRIG